jgi:hypothetical protein
MRKLLWVVVGLALLGGGGWLGAKAAWRLHEEGVKKGCLQSFPDVVPVRIEPAAPGHLRFAALGDTGTGNAGARRVAATLQSVCAREGCDFVTLLGDNFYPNGVSGMDDPLFDHAFESVYAALQVPVLAILGNHDVRGPVAPQVFHSRESRLWRMPNFAYRFQAGAARFFAVNTNCQPVTWWELEPQLAEPFAGWTFVLGHHSLYSTGPHGDANWSIRWLWSDLVPRVDFYLAGHNHLLEHFQRPGERTEYVVSGSAGDDPADPARSEGPSAAQRRFQSYAPGFAWFDVTERQVTLRFYADGGDVLYESVRTRPAN